MTKRKVPSSNGVSAGPIITAFLGALLAVTVGSGKGVLVRTDQVMTFSGTGAAETPAGGSVCIRFEESCQPSFCVNSGLHGSLGI